MPRSPRISSPSRDVGPFAPSATSFVWSSPAFAAVTWFSVAARTSTSQGSSSRRWFETSGRAGEARDAVVLGAPLVEGLQVEPSLVVDAAGDVGDADHTRPAEGELVGRDGADLPVALDDAARAVERPAEPAHGLLHDHDDPDPGRLGPEDTAAHGERLAGDDLRHGVADLHRVGVHHPGHRLLVGGHVGSGDVALRADDRQELGGEPPRQALELSAGEVPRVAAHSALRAAVREAQERASSRSSTSRARRTRRASPPCRSGSRPSSGQGRSNAGRDSPGRRRACRRPGERGWTWRGRARDSGAPPRRTG